MMFSDVYGINRLGLDTDSPLSIQSFGGAGGGAIELVATNDIIVGSYGKIYMVGEDGSQANEGTSSIRLVLLNQLHSTNYFRWRRRRFRWINCVKCWRCSVIE